MGGAVDQQLSRDVVLLDDLRGTLNQVMAWDHTQGGSDPAAVVAGGGVSSGGGNGGSGSQEKGAFVDSLSPADGSPPALDQQNSKISDSSGGAQTASNSGQQQEVSNVRSPGLSADEKTGTGTGKDGLVEYVPIVLGRRAGDDNLGGHHSAGGAEFIDGISQEPGSSRRGRPSTGRHGSGGGIKGSADDVEWGGGCSVSNKHHIISGTVSNDDAGSTTTTTSATTGSNGSCSEWVRRQQKRTTPTPLTDHERMSLLQHVRPSVFGEPQALSHQQRRSAAAATARPRSAAATANGHARRRGGIPGGYHHHHYRHEAPPRATTARRRSSGEPPGGSEMFGPIHRANGSSIHSSSTTGASKHGGVLVHDGWVAGEGEPSPCVLSMPTGAAATTAVSPSGSRFRYAGGVGTTAVGSGGRGGGGSGSTSRPVSLVNSVAFGVNMGVLDALSDTTASATAATAFASAAAGQGTTTSTMRSSRLSSGRKMNNTNGNNEKRRGQSAPRTGRQT